MIIFLILLSLVCLEYGVSLYRKDGKYSLKPTIINIITGIGVFSVGYIVHAHYFPYLKSLFGKYIEISSTTQVTIFSFIACLIIVDFCYYVLHWIHHVVPFFWTFHSVHHGDTSFNFSTNFRHFWFEEFYMFIFYLPALLAGFPLNTIISAYLLGYAYQCLVHSAYPWPKFLDLILVTPNNHKNHHNQNRMHQDSNYGGIFSIWDRMFGTYTESIKDSDFNAGIKGYYQANPVKVQTDPIVTYLKEF